MSPGKIVWRGATFRRSTTARSGGRMARFADVAGGASHRPRRGRCHAHAELRTARRNQSSDQSGTDDGRGLTQYSCFQPPEATHSAAKSPNVPW